ncbi:MAG: formyltransferase family protein, partial [Planctomycetota bacterium]
MKLLFFGSPQFAVPSLRALHGAGHEIGLVVTRPDRPRGRHGAPAPTAVKEQALELGLEVFQHESADEPRAVEKLREAGAELGVVAAYGDILGALLLGAARRGFLNVHPSLL